MMVKQNKLSLDQYKAKLIEKMPEFETAIREEESYLAVCRKARGDLQQLRKNLGMKQADVAAKLQMSQPGVSKIEKGEGDIGLLTLCRYAGALGMQPTISFAPAASTYLVPSMLTEVVRAMGRLSSNRSAKAEDANIARPRAHLPAKAVTAAIRTYPPSAPLMAAWAEAVSGAMAQSVSIEIANAMAALSELSAGAPHDLDMAKDNEKHSHAAST